MSESENNRRSLETAHPIAVCGEPTAAVVSVTDPIESIVKYLSRVAAEEEARQVRRIVIEWLPRGLKWLVDRPRLLHLYMRLPHRTAPVCVVSEGGRTVVWKIANLKERRRSKHGRDRRPHQG